MSNNNIEWNKTLSPTINALPDSGLSAFLDILANNKDIVSLSIGEPDFAPPKTVREKAIEIVQKGQTSYTSTFGLLELRKAIANNFEKQYNVSYSPENEIAITTGVSEALDLAMRILLNPGDEVLLPEPCYVANKACVILAGGKPISVKTTAENGFVVTPEQLEKSITPRTKALILGYPSNPTGATMNKEQLQKVADIAQKHNLIVISDELYAALTFDGEHTCFSSLAGMKERTILLSGFSKAYAMTGYRVGYVLAPKEVIKAMIAIRQYTMLCAPTIAQHAALEALNNCQKDCEMMIESYNKRRQMIYNGFKQIGLPVFEPKGAFYIFPDIRKSGLTSAEFCQQLITKAKVAVVPGHAFGESGEGFIRCCYAVSEENIKIALERIEQFINQK